MQMVDADVPSDMDHYFEFLQSHHCWELQKQTGNHRQIFRSALDMSPRNQEDIIGLDVFDGHCKFSFKIYRGRRFPCSDLAKDAPGLFFESVEQWDITSPRSTRNCASEMPSQSQLLEPNRIDSADRISVK